MTLMEGPGQTATLAVYRACKTVFLPSRGEAIRIDFFGHRIGYPFPSRSAIHGSDQT